MIDAIGFDISVEQCGSSPLWICFIYARGIWAYTGELWGSRELAEGEGMAVVDEWLG